jgi:AraC-like DNA-binding protein
MKFWSIMNLPFLPLLEAKSCGSPAECWSVPIHCSIVPALRECETAVAQGREEANNWAQRRGRAAAQDQTAEAALDVLSDVLSNIRLTGAVYFDIDAGVPWVGESPNTQAIAAAIMPDAEHVISFHVVMSGTCWASVDDDPLPPERLTAGDVIIFPRGSSNVLSSSPGKRGSVNMAMYYRPIDDHLPFKVVHGAPGEERTHFVCGYLGCDTRPFNPLLAALPAMVRVPKPSDGPWVTDLFKMALAEGSSQRAGRETILSKVSELMFVEVIRRYLESLPHDSRGWLSGLRDPQIGQVLALIHSRPAEDWTLERLARAAGLSRSTLASRFIHFVGVSPIHYLTSWRMQVAARRLELPGASLAQIGSDVGYESEAAFNRAFKKVVGLTPGAWRKNRVPRQAGAPG